MSAAFESWAIVELMGHVRMAGRVTEEQRFGATLGRIDIPQGEGFFTQFFQGASIYRLTPCSEEVARSVAKHAHIEPIHQWEVPKLAPAHVVERPALTSSDGGEGASYYDPDSDDDEHY